MVFEYCILWLVILKVRSFQNENSSNGTTMNMQKTTEKAVKEKIVLAWHEHPAFLRKHVTNCGKRNDSHTDSMKMKTATSKNCSTQPAIDNSLPEGTFVYFLDKLLKKCHNNSEDLRYYEKSGSSFQGPAMMVNNPRELEMIEHENVSVQLPISRAVHREMVTGYSLDGDFLFVAFSYSPGMDIFHLFAYIR